MSSPVPDEDIPEPDAVLQHEPMPVLAAPVPVAVDGPVKTQTLPGNPQWAAFRQTFDQTTPQQLLGADPRRKRAVVCGEGGFGFFLGQDRNGLSSGRAFRCTVNVPLEFTHTGEIWALGDGGAAVLSVYVEQWAD